MAVRTRIGVMVPSTNTTFEADCQLVAPEGVTIPGHRPTSFRMPKGWTA